MNFISLLLSLVCIFIFAGCAPLNDTAGRVSDDLGDVSDEIGREQKLGKGDDGIVIHPQGDKKIKMDF